MTPAPSGDFDPIVTITDVRRAGHCPSGTKRWMEAHGFDFRAFLRDGLPASRLLATGDGLAEQVVAHMKAGADG